MLRLSAGSAVAEILPGMGGGVASLSVGGRPALRPWSGQTADGPFSLGMNLLLPFSNRINGGFSFEGRRYDLSPNLPGEPYPIHGDAFQRAWSVVESGPGQALLRLSNGHFGPFRYRAEVHYRLGQDRLTTHLSAVNTGADAMPFGGGFHPWFPRSLATRIRFTCRGVWRETPDHLRAGSSPEEVGEWDWTSPGPLPKGWINAGFECWDGAADIEQGEGALSLSVRAPGLTTVLLYSPSSASDYFCLEPVSHPVDAHNLPGQPGLIRLPPGARWETSMTLLWQADP